MKIKKSQQESVSLFDKIAGQLAMMLSTKTQPFFISLLFGALLTIARRRTVTHQWLWAAQISDNFREAFYHMSHIGRKGVEVSAEWLVASGEWLVEVQSSERRVQSIFLCTILSAL